MTNSRKFGFPRLASPRCACVAAVPSVDDSLGLGLLGALSIASLLSRLPASDWP
jgi:hypothetical protein